MIPSTTQTLVIDGWLPEPNANVRSDDWRKRQARLKQAQAMVALHAKRAGWVPVRGKAHLSITLVFGEHRRRDTDNLYARCKGLIDGLVKGGWIRDDSSDVLELDVRAQVSSLHPGEKVTMLTLRSI